MVTHCSTHRRTVPEPIRSPQDALRALGLATDGGRDRAVVLACLDADRRPLTLFVVDECPPQTECLVQSLDVLLGVARERPSPLAALVMATSGPDRPTEPSASDLELWPDLVGRCRKVGIALLDWFILAPGAATSVATRRGEEVAW